MDGHHHLQVVSRKHGHRCRALLVLLTITTVGDGRGGSPLPVRERYEPRTFLGHLCRDDCAALKAGFAAADAAGGELDCERYAREFRDGCRVRRELRIDAATAGVDWAIENEIAEPRDCDGAGARFRRGCLSSLPASVKDYAQPGN